jgi:hypothetical protein
MVCLLNLDSRGITRYFQQLVVIQFRFPRSHRDTQIDLNRSHGRRKQENNRPSRFLPRLVSLHRGFLFCKDSSFKSTCNWPCGFRMQALWGEGGSERPVASSGASSSLLQWYARAAGKRGLGSILLGVRLEAGPFGKRRDHPGRWIPGFVTMAGNFVPSPVAREPSPRFNCLLDPGISPHRKDLTHGENCEHHAAARYPGASI